MDRKIVFYIFFQAAILFFVVMCSRDHDAAASEISDSKPDIPRINAIGISKVQPQESDEDVIWYDDFTEKKPYLESSGDIDYTESFGNRGGSLNMGFRKGEISGDGNRKLAFGDFPDGSSVIQAGKRYDEIYWRIYVKHEYGWQGAPAKMSRATSIGSERWQQAMIAHVWSGEANSITLDPASGVKDKTDSMMVSTSTGVFTGSLTTRTRLTSGAVFYCRVRQKSSNGNWSDWSRWHQPFVVE